MSGYSNSSYSSGHWDDLAGTMDALRREIGPPTDRDDKWQPMVSAGEVRLLLDTIDDLAAVLPATPPDTLAAVRALAEKWESRSVPGEWSMAIHPRTAATELRAALAAASPVAADTETADQTQARPGLSAADRGRIKGAIPVTGGSLPPQAQREAIMRGIEPIIERILADHVAPAISADTETEEVDPTLCAEHRDGKPGDPHEWRRGRRGRTKLVICRPTVSADTTQEYVPNIANPAPGHLEEAERFLDGEDFRSVPERLRAAVEELNDIIVGVDNESLGGQRFPAMVRTDELLPVLNELCALVGEDE